MTKRKGSVAALAGSIGDFEQWSLDQDRKKPKPKKRDPLASLKKKHPGPWKAAFTYEGMVSTKFSWMSDWAVCDKNKKYIVLCRSRSLARAVAKLGGGK